MAFNITNIKLTLEQLANSSEILVVDMKETRAYVDGKIVPDKVVGYTYSVVCPKAKYVSFNIKVEESTPSITKEELENKQVVATPIGFEGKFYRSNTGEYILTAKAQSMQKAVAKNV